MSAQHDVSSIAVSGLFVKCNSYPTDSAVPLCFLCFLWSEADLSAIAIAASKQNRKKRLDVLIADACHPEIALKDVLDTDLLQSALLFRMHPVTAVLKTGVFRGENGWKLRKNERNSRETSRIVFFGVVNLERIVPFRPCGAPVCFSTGNGIRGRGTPMGYRRQRVSREARRLLYREGYTTGA